MGFFENLLEGFFKIIGAIAYAIRRVFLIIADIVTFIGTEILPIVAAVFAVVGLTIGAIAIFAPAAATAIVNFLVYGSVVLTNVNLGIMSSSPVAVNFSFQVLKTTVATFLEIIHFDTIMALHNIMWVLSEEYRKTLSKVFKSMSAISSELFGWSLGLRVILENSRSIILNSAASLGYSYDVSQLVWLNAMTDFTVKFNDHAALYADDPEQLFFDLEEWIDKNAIDVSAGSHALIFNSVQSITIGLERNAQNIQRIDTMAHENDRGVKRLTAGHFGERIDYNFNLFRQFQGDDYAPRQDQQEKAINTNRQETAENRKTLSDLNWKLRRPAGQLETLDEMEQPDKYDEEIKIEDLSTRPYQAESADLESDQAAADAEQEQENIERDAEQQKPAAVETIPFKPVTKHEYKPRPPVNTWFVGEY